jgi:endonuclease/exonuclease/phosphatase family metal-dependent hydrolase
MKLLTWNIRCQNSTDDARGCGWKVRCARVIATVHALAPDVLAVQEALASQMDDLRAALPNFEAVGVGRDDGEQKGEFCGLLYRRERFELRASSTRWLSPTPEEPSRGWDATLNRIATSARLFDSKSRCELEVWNTHFDHYGEQARLESARFVRRELENLPVPVVLCGDFNASPGSAPIRELLSGTLCDARALSKQEPCGEVATFCGFDEPLLGEEWRIDWVFVSPKWEIESYAVSPSLFSNWPPSSDHRPVVVELELS